MIARIAPYLIALAIFAADRLSKIWIDSRLSAFDVRVVIPGLFNIIHSENRGMAFSLFADSRPEVRSVLLVGVSVVVLAGVAVMLWQSSQRLQRAALTLVMGGAVGNLYDRIVRGSVTDFLDVYVNDYHWPTFNVADSAITVGAILLALELFLPHKTSTPAPTSGHKGVEV